MPKTRNLIQNITRIREKGYIKPERLPSGKMRFREEDVERLAGIIRKKKIVLYARVSSQKDDLVNQVNYLKEKVPEHDIIITDIRSGLNMKRKGFQRLLKMILNNEVNKIVIAYPDRLVRFGFEIIEEICKTHGCEIIVLEKKTKHQNKN